MALRYKKSFSGFCVVMNFMNYMNSEYRAATSADRVITDWQLPTASDLFLSFLSLFVHLLLGFTHVLQLFLDR